MTGYAGDTLASALLANDTPFRARSISSPPRRHDCRQRRAKRTGHCVSGSGQEPNVRPLLELYDGLKAESQNKAQLNWDLWPSMILPPFWALGFIIKLMLKPLGKLYEPLIWRAAGLGALHGT